MKVDALSQLGRQAEALESANLAIQYPNPSSKLLKLRAELILSLGQTVEDMQVALDSIDRAIQLYEQESVNEDIQSRFDNIDSFKFWFGEKTKSRTEMASLKADIKSLIYALNIYSQVQDIQSNLAQEKVKIIELMAIFTAILALIFANVQFASKLDLNGVLVANGALLIALTWMLWLAQRIGSHQSLLPRLNLKKILGGFLLLSFCLLVIIGLAFLIVLFIRWAT